MATTRAIRKDEVDFWAQRMEQYVEENSSVDPNTSPDWCFSIVLPPNSNEDLIIKAGDDAVTYSKLTSVLPGYDKNHPHMVLVTKNNTSLPKNTVFLPTTSSAENQLYNFATGATTLMYNHFSFRITTVYMSLASGKTLNTQVAPIVGVKGVPNDSFAKASIKNFIGLGSSFLAYPYGLDVSTTIPITGNTNLTYTAPTNKSMGIYTNVRFVVSRASGLGPGKIQSTLSDSMATLSDNVKAIILFARFSIGLSTSAKYAVSINNPFKGCSNITINT